MKNTVEIEGFADPRKDADDADCVVCVPVKFLPEAQAKNGVRTTCSQCGEPVWLAPSSPRKPPRVCWECAAPIIRAAMEDDGIKIGAAKHLAEALHELFGREGKGVPKN